MVRQRPECTAAGWEKIRKEEVKHIRNRRLAAGIPLPAKREERRKHIEQSGIGLALSGGGIRSASFNLGLLQALYEKGILRFVDYLTSVSGGGYVASQLASRVLRGELPMHGGPRDGASAEDHSSSSENDARSFQPHEYDRQSPSLLRLIHGGLYLAKPRQLFNRWLIGFFLILVLVFSGLIALDALAALLFRCLDQPETMFWLQGFGWGDDVARALFPSLLIFLAWFVAWAISYGCKRSRSRGRVAEWLVVALVVSLLIGMAGLVGTGDIDLAFLMRSLGKADAALETGQIVTKNVKTIGMMAAVLVGLALLPILVPRQLLRSGVKPSKPVERVIFWLSTRALLIGLPLVVFGMVARENVSHYNEKRESLVAQDLHYPDAFWQQVESEYHTSKEPGTRILLAAYERITGDGANQNSLRPDSAVADRVRKYVRETDGMLERASQINDEINDSPYSVIRRCASIVGSLWGSGKSNEVRQIVRSFEVWNFRQEDLFRAISQSVVPKVDLYAKLDSPKKKERNAEFDKLIEKARVLEQRLSAKVPQEQAALRHAICLNNRQLLHLHYANSMWPKTPSYALVVAEKDQQRRWVIFLWSALIFLVASLSVNLNNSSLHRFYRDQLAEAWIEEVQPRKESTAQDQSAKTSRTKDRRRGRTILLRQLKTTALGAPYHLICATLNWIGQRSDKTQGQQEQFLLSRAFCGSESTQYQRTHDYSSGTCDLANAVAISGAALSPFQGTNPLVCVLLFLLNIRLGQWLPHPGKGCLPASMSPAELLYRLVKNWFCRTQDWNYFFVTDGGHFDNLGLESLLDRRCRLIVVSDATCDPNSTFGDFLRVHQRMRIRRGIKLCALEYGGELPLGELQPQAEEPKLCRNHFFVGRIMYPADQDQPASEGCLIYLKPTFTGDEGIELLEYRKQSGEFPNDSTANQFYPPDRFEAYRKLGYHIGESLCGAEMPRMDRPGETCSLLQFLEGLVRREEGTESSKDLLQRVREDLPVDVHPGNIGSYIEALASADPEAIELVTKVLKLEYVDSSDAAMLATLLPYLEHDNPTIRAVLVRIVGKLRPTPPTCRDWLETRRQRDDDPGVQEAVAEVLKTLG